MPKLFIYLLVLVLGTILFLYFRSRKEAEIDPKKIEEVKRMMAEQEAEDMRRREEGIRKAEAENQARHEEQAKEFEKQRLANLERIQKEIEAQQKVFEANSKEADTKQAANWAAQQAAKDAAEAADKAVRIAEATKFQAELAAQREREAAERAKALEAEKIQAAESNADKVPLEFIQISRFPPPYGTYNIEIAELEVYDLGNNLIPILSHGYNMSAEDQKYNKIPSSNIADKDINTFASVVWDGEERPNNHIFVKIKPTSISKISKIVIKAKKGDDLMGTMLTFFGSTNGSQVRILTPMFIRKQTNVYSFKSKIGYEPPVTSPIFSWVEV